MKKTQEEFIKEILGLKAANPEMPIRFLVDSYQVTENAWTHHCIIEVVILPWYDNGETFITDEADIWCLLGEMHGLTKDSEIQKIYDISVEKVICVYTGAA